MLPPYYVTTRVRLDSTATLELGWIVQQHTHTQAIHIETHIARDVVVVVVVVLVYYYSLCKTTLPSFYNRFPSFVLPMRTRYSCIHESYSIYYSIILIHFPHLVTNL